MEQAQQENALPDTSGGQNKLEMLEMLLHNDLYNQQQTQLSGSAAISSTANNQFSSMLPSEPQVMRTKRMSHRKASSTSFMIPGAQSGNSSILSSSAGGGVSQYQMEHARTISLDLTPDNFLFQAGGGATSSPDPQQQQNGHRRFHSMGNNISPYSFPQQQQFFNQPAYAGHQKSMSGTSAMFEEFNDMNMVMNKDQSGELMMPTMRRLHPLMNEQMPMDSSSSATANLVGGLYSQPFSDSTQAYFAEDGSMYLPQHQAEETQLDVSFDDDETGFAEGYGIDEDLEQVITLCSWQGCNLEASSQDSLVTHILQDHVGSGKASYVCEWADCNRLQKPFTKRHKIQNHIRIHTGERPFPCPIADCGKKFSRQDGLNTHIKTHSNVKPYVCSYHPCGKAYFHSRSLRKHQRTHLEFGNREIQFTPTIEQENIVDLSPYIYQQTHMIPTPQETGLTGYLAENASLTHPEQIQPTNTLFSHQLNQLHQMPNLIFDKHRENS